MKYVPAIVRRCKKGSIEVFPTYYCRTEDLMEATGMGREELLEDLESGSDCTKLLRYSVLQPIVPRCLTLINFKTSAGRSEAAEILLDQEKYDRLPDELLKRGFDPKRFREYSQYMDKEGRDYVFGEIFGTPDKWAFNCYVKVPVEGISMERELPVMMVYNNPAGAVKLWYIGEENGKMLFMHSTVNIPNVSAQITAPAGKGLTVNVMGVGTRQRIRRVK